MSTSPFEATPAEISAVLAMREQNGGQPVESLPDRMIVDDPESPLERAQTEPPRTLAELIENPDVPPETLVRLDNPLAETLQEAIVSERAGELQAQLHDLPSDVVPVSEQGELVEIWKTLGQLGVAFTDVSTRLAKVEKFLGISCSEARMGDHPDWDRYIVRGQAVGAMVGDPTRWGANLFQVVSAVNTLQFLGSEQIISAACRDQYSRPWSIAGVITAPADLWALPQGLGLNEWQMAMSIMMGVGQTQIFHNINVREFIDSQDAFYFNSQNPPEMFGTIGDRARPFVINEPIVASQISVQMFVRIQLNPAPVVPFNIKTSLVISPVAAGVDPPALQGNKPLAEK